MPQPPSAMPQYFKFGTVIVGIICKTTIDPSHYESRATVTRDATIPELEAGDWSERRAPLKPLTQLRDACFA